MTDTWLQPRALCLIALCLAAPAAASVVLRAGTTTELEPLSPVVTTGFWYGTGYTAFLHMPLITYRAPDGDFGPCLARRWEIAADNRSILFELFAGARWHDGAPVTSADVTFTLEYLKEQQLIGQLWRFLDHVEEVDRLTARVHFTAPVAYYQSLSFPWPKILPEHIWEHIDEPLAFQGDSAMVGCGPFALEHYDENSRTAVLRKSSEFFGIADGGASADSASIRVDELRIRYYATTDVLLLALRQGEIDVIMGPSNEVPLSHVPALESDSSIELHTIPDSGVPLMLVFHYSQWPARLPAFRLAVALAVDSAALIRTVARGRGKVPELGFVPPPAWTYGGPMPALRRDLERSRALLDSIGLVDRDGDGLREDIGGEPLVLELIPETWQDPLGAIRAVEMLIYQLGAVGIRATMDKHVLEEEYQLLWEERGYMAYVGHATHASVRDGGHVYFANYRDFSYGTFEDSSYFAILDRVTSAPDRDSYLDAVRDSQRYNARLLPGIALAWGDKYFAYRDDRIAGWQPMAAYGIPNYDSWFALTPVAAEASAPATRSWLWLCSLAALFAVAAVVIFRRR